MNGSAHLKSYARARLAHAFGDAPGVLDKPELFRTILAEIPAECLKCLPGLVELVRHEPDCWPPRPWLELHQPGRVSPIFDESAALALESLTVQRLVLESKTYMLAMTVEATEPGPSPVYNRSGKWKRHPPSRRRRMRSWRCAPDSEKLRYAPLAGLRSVPWWARHPDAGRIVPIGNVQVTQQIFVYSQRGMDSLLKDQLEAYSREWRLRVVEALR